MKCLRVNFLLKWGVMLPVEINWSAFNECIYGS